MKRLLVYLKDYKKETVLGPLFKLLEASFELIVPLVMAAIIDVGIANADKQYIYRMCGILILLQRSDWQARSRHSILQPRQQ